MAKLLQFTLIALSININGRLYRKEEGFVFDESNTDPKSLKDAIDAGFLRPVDETEAKKAAEEKELAEIKAKAKEDAIAAGKAEAKKAAEEKTKAKTK